MRDSRFRNVLVLGIAIFCALCAHAQAGPEEQALIEIVTAKNVSAIERHLPESLRARIAELPMQERRSVQERIWQPFGRKDLRVIVPEGGQPFLVFEHVGSERPERIEIVVTRKISNGLDAILELQPKPELDGAESPDPLQVWMRFEEGEWKVTELNFGAGRSVRFDGSFIHDWPTAPVGEAAAVGALRTLNTAQVTYSSTFPEIGFADNLEALGPPGTPGAPGREPDQRHSGLIDPVLASGEKSGYRFFLTTDSHLPHENYQIIARPISREDGTRKSFFTDTSGVIRVTDEDRDATASDRPLR